MSQKRIIKAAGLMGFWTLASRVLGMVRDIVSAKAFGTSWQWDAFLYSFMLPNFLRRVVGEGGLSSAFIPVYSDTLEKQGNAESFRFANITLTMLGTGLGLFILILDLVLSLVLYIPHLSPTLRLTVDLLRYMFPYLWFMSLFALGMGVLNSHHHFFAPSFAPVILNLVWIGAVIWLLPYVGPDLTVKVRWLAVMVLISGLLQLLVELPPLYQLGFRVRWIWDIYYPGLLKAWNLILPIIFGFTVVQINILVDMTIAMLLGPGANSSLWYGNRLMQFPLSLFAVGMGAAVLPALSQHTARQEFAEAKRTLSFALRSVFLIVIPSSVGLMVLNEPIVRLLFQRGEFDALSTQRTAAVLLFYAIGLFAYSGQKILTAGFYGAQNTKTPMKIGIAALLVNIALNLALMVPMAEAGLAFATSLSAILQMGLLGYFYHRQIAEIDFKEIFTSFLKVCLASTAMGISCWLVYKGLQMAVSGSSLFNQAIQVGGAITFSVLVYIAFCFIFRVREMNQAFQWGIQKFDRLTGKS